MHTHQWSRVTCLSLPSFYPVNFLIKISLFRRHQTTVQTIAGTRSLLTFSLSRHFYATYDFRSFSLMTGLITMKKPVGFFRLFWLILFAFAALPNGASTTIRASSSSIRATSSRVSSTATQSSCLPSPTFKAKVFAGLDLLGLEADINADFGVRQNVPGFIGIALSLQLGTAANCIAYALPNCTGIPLLTINADVLDISLLIALPISSVICNGPRPGNYCPCVPDPPRSFVAEFIDDLGVIVAATVSNLDACVALPATSNIVSVELGIANYCQVFTHNDCTTSDPFFSILNVDVPDLASANIGSYKCFGPTQPYPGVVCPSSTVRLSSTRRSSIASSLESN